MNLVSKENLRRHLRDVRRGLNKQQHNLAASGLLENILASNVLFGHTKIAMYIVHDGEINPEQVMRWCWGNGMQTYVPVVAKGHATLMFSPVTGDTRYAKNCFGIKEPIVDETKKVTAIELDLVLVPLVAFDRRGNRLGMGGGFYDTTFEFMKNTDNVKPQLVGAAHEVQCVEEIQTEPWDIPLSTIVTDQQVYQFSA